MSLFVLHFYCVSRPPISEKKTFGKGVSFMSKNHRPSAVLVLFFFLSARIPKVNFYYYISLLKEIAPETRGTPSRCSQCARLRLMCAGCQSSVEFIKASDGPSRLKRPSLFSVRDGTFCSFFPSLGQWMEGNPPVRLFLEYGPFSSWLTSGTLTN